MEDEIDRTNVVWGVIGAIGLAVGLSILELGSVLHDVVPALSHGDGAYAAGVITGQATVSAAIAWLLVWFAYGRRRTPGLGWIYFAIPLAVCLLIFAGVSGLARMGFGGRDAQMRIALQEVVKTMDVAMNGHGQQIDMRIHATGDGGEVERAAKGMMANLLTERTAYEAKMAGLGIKTIMLPPNLAADRGLKHTQANLAEARAALKQYRQANKGLSADFHARIAATHLDAATKARVLKGFDAAVLRDQDARETVWACEDGIFSEFQKMATILAHPKGRWTAKDGKIVFTSRTDLSAYQDDLAIVRTYQNQERAVIAQVRAQARQSVDQAQQGQQ
jgi:hypothetical protein